MRDSCRRLSKSGVEETMATIQGALAAWCKRLFTLKGNVAM